MKKSTLFLFLFCLGFHCWSQIEEVTLISWNIRDFGKTKNSDELEQIATIVKDADIIAIQEVVAGFGGRQAVAKLADILSQKGDSWEYAISDPTKSSKYLTERYAYIWKGNKIKAKRNGYLLEALEESVDREPFVMEFYIDNTLFTLLNYHAISHSKNPKLEIETMANYIVKTIKRPTVLIGDFNLNESDPVFDILKEGGFYPLLTTTQTTLKSKCKNNKYLNHAIDNIFFSSDLKLIDGNIIDFVGNCDRIKQARQLSDHLPVYLTLKIEN